MANQSFSDMLFGFPDDEDDPPAVFVSPNNQGSCLDSSESSDHYLDQGQEVEEEEKESCFWENQNQILQVN